MPRVPRQEPSHLRAQLRSFLPCGWRLDGVLNSRLSLRNSPLPAALPADMMKRTLTPRLWASTSSRVMVGLARFQLNIRIFCVPRTLLIEFTMCEITRRLASERSGLLTFTPVFGL